MEYRRILGTDLDVSAICFGMMYGSKARKAPELKAHALRRALEGGVNCIHSCVEYGTWPVLSSVLDEWPKRDEIVHIIKMDVPNNDDNNTFYPEKFRRRVEDHLVALRTDRIHILQYMWRIAPGTDEEPLPLLQRIIDGVVDTFAQLYSEGKAGYLMVFPSADCIAETIETGHFSGLIGPCSLARLDYASYCNELEQRNMGLLGFSPLHGGSLTDKHKEFSSLENDDRRNNPFYKTEYEKRRKIVESFGDEIGASLTSFSLRALLASPVVGCLITGMSTTEQVDEILTAVDGPVLPRETFNRALDLWRTELQ